MKMVNWGSRRVPAEYLGDGVYAIFNGEGIWLHVNSHEFPTDRIYLETEVLEKLNSFAKEVEKWEKEKD